MRTLSAVLVVLTLARCASALTIEFEEIYPCQNSFNYAPDPYVTNGFSFSALPTAFKIFEACESGELGIGNGTDFGAWIDGENPTIHYNMEISSASPFSIQQVDLGQMHDDPPGGGTIRVSGLYSGGGAPSSIEFDTLRGSFTTFLFPNEWTNLTQVEFRQLDDLVVRNVIDNVVVNENFPIPEPSTVTLAVVALLTCCGRRKR